MCKPASPLGAALREAPRATAIKLTDWMLDPDKQRPALSFGSVVSFLTRVLIYVYLMMVNYPQTLYKAMKQVVVEWKTHGCVPSKMFASYEPHVGYKAGAFYSSQVIFEKRFTDPERLRSLFLDLCEEVGIEREAGCVTFTERKLNHPVNANTPACIPANYYVGEEGSNFKKDAKDYKKFKVALAVFQESNDPSANCSNEGCVIQAHLPGGTWDGTSCFNFMKALVARYYGDEPNLNVSKGHKLTTISEKAARSFDSIPHVAYFIARMPYGIFMNESIRQWSEASHRAGVPHMKEEEREMAIMNMSAEESKAFAMACKNRKAGRIAPTAALMYAGVTAYREITGEYPYCVPIQASLQTRSCEPVFAERSFIGDWLVGPLHYVRSAPKEMLRDILGRPAQSDMYYTLEHAQGAYEELLKDLDGSDGAVRRAFHARVFGVKKGGAAQFEKAPEYADDNRLMDSFFFNNYGKRNFHEDAGCVAWNWSGPGFVGCNNILMNGQISACFASQQLGIDKITQVRNAAYRILREITNEA